MLVMFSIGIISLMVNYHIRDEGEERDEG